jgi:hypothetical protein
MGRVKFIGDDPFFVVCSGTHITPAPCNREIQNVPKVSKLFLVRREVRFTHSEKASKT